jgi:hypothetical protein
MSEEIATTWVFRLLMGAVCACILMAWGAGALPQELVARVCLCTTLLLLVALLWQRLLPLWQMPVREVPPVEKVEVAIDPPVQGLTPHPGTTSLPTHPGV